LHREKTGLTPYDCATPGRAPRAYAWIAEAARNATKRTHDAPSEHFARSAEDDHFERSAVCLAPHSGSRDGIIAEL
jgi:hypothetical protein